MELLREQFLALTSSSRSYGEGNFWEAKRLATAIHIICHDPPLTGRNSRSKSLLSQMGLEDETLFLSSARPMTPTMVPWTPLAYMFSKGEPLIFVPTLESSREFWRHMKFNKWWDEPVFRTADGKELGRKYLVKPMRDQDGGSHADISISNREYAVMRSIVDPRIVTGFSDEGTATMKFSASVKGAAKFAAEGFHPIKHAHTATVRQVAFEVMNSIEHLL